MTQWLQHKRWQRFDTSWRLKRWTPNFTVHPVRSNVASSAWASSNEPSTCCSWIWLIFFCGRYRDVTNDAWNHPQITWCQPDVRLVKISKFCQLFYFPTIDPTATQLTSRVLQVGRLQSARGARGEGARFTSPRNGDPVAIHVLGKVNHHKSSRNG